MTGVYHDQPLQIARAGLARVQAMITEEDVLARVYANDLMALQDSVPDRGNLLPGTLHAALQGENPLRNAIARLVTPIIAGGAQWDGDEGFPEPAKALLVTLASRLGELATNLALYGKAALFPHFATEQDALPTLAVLSGTLYPITDPIRLGELESLIVFTPQHDSYGLNYVPVEYLPGEVRRYPPTISPALFRDGMYQTAKQPHTPDRLPVSYRAFEKDRYGTPHGPGGYALSAMRRFTARLAQENIVYNASAGPQRVITGDMGGAGNTTLGPYKTIRLPLGADFKIVGPDVAALNQHTQARHGAANDVLVSAGSPEGFVGPGDSGESRAIAGQMHEQTSGRIGDLCAEILTDTALLLYRMGALPNPITFTVKASFPAKRTTEQQNITAMFRDKVIDRYEALLRLQDAGVKISDDELKRAKQERSSLEAQAPQTLAESLLGTAPPWVALKALMIAYPQLGITEEDVAAQRGIDLAPTTPATSTTPTGAGTGGQP